MAKQREPTEVRIFKHTLFSHIAQSGTDSPELSLPEEVTSGLALGPARRLFIRAYIVPVAIGGVEKRMYSWDLHLRDYRKALWCWIEI